MGSCGELGVACALRWGSCCARLEPIFCIFIFICQTFQSPLHHLLVFTGLSNAWLWLQETDLLELLL